MNMAVPHGTFVDRCIHRSPHAYSIIFQYGTWRKYIWWVINEEELFGNQIDTPIIYPFLWTGKYGICTKRMTFLCLA